MLINTYTVRPVLTGLIFFLVMLPSIQIERVAGLMPYHYFFLYCTVFYLIIRQRFIEITEVACAFLIFFVGYFLYSTVITTDFVATIVYFILWLFNIIILIAISSLDRSVLERFFHAYSVFIFTSLLLGLLLMLFIGSPHANPFIAWDKNNFSFAVYLAAASCFCFNKKKLGICIVALSLLVFSRTLLLMMLVGLLFYYAKKSFKKVFYIITLFILVNIVLYKANIPELAFFYERITGIFTLVSSLIEFSQTGHMDSKLKIDDWRRYYLIIANIDIVKTTFPVGTGMGLSNYLSYFDLQYLAFTGRAARAHNFYISYLGEMGVLFFVFITLIIYSIVKVKNLFLQAAIVGMVIGLATNEYVTSPMFWALLGLGVSQKEDGDAKDI